MRACHQPSTLDIRMVMQSNRTRPLYDENEPIPKHESPVRRRKRTGTLGFITKDPHLAFDCPTPEQCQSNYYLDRSVNQ